MNYKLEILELAWNDVDRIQHWLMERSLEGAARWYVALHECLNSLKLDPLRSGLAYESAELGLELRERLFKTPKGKKYRIVYEVEGYIVRVLHIRAQASNR